jgi:hypothetical protein
MNSTISLADLTVANDGPVDQVEYARRTAMAAKVLDEFASQTAVPALESLLSFAASDTPADLAQARAQADQVTRQAGMLLAEVDRFTAMASRR